MRQARAVLEGARRWRAKLSGFARSSRGTTAITFAALAPFMLGAFGIASDSATYVMKRSSLQSVTDAAALAAAKELAIAANGDEEIKAAARSMVAVEFGSESGATQVTVTVNRADSSVNVALAETWTPIFAHFIKTDVTPIRTTATAMLAGMSNVCVLALNPNQADAIRMTKSARVTANGCGVYSNSAHAEGIRLEGNSSVTAQIICSVGGVNAKAGAFSPEPTTDCPAVPDPLSNRAEPTYGGCDFTGKKADSGTITLEPGVYCGGIAISGNTNATFKPGIYVLKGGPLQIAGHGSAKGEHVGFFLDGKASMIDISGNALVEFTGPKDGEMAGLLFYESRKNQLDQQHRIRGDMVKRLTGTIYLPRGYLLIDPNATVAQNSEYTAIIVRRLEVREAPDLVLNSSYNATDVPVPQGIRATAQVVLTQ